MSDADEVIRAAEEVAGILESRGVGAVVIGAVALAAHGYGACWPTDPEPSLPSRRSFLTRSSGRCALRQV